MSRKSRGFETRDHDTQDKRPTYKMDYSLSTDVPEYLKRPGFSYMWERHSLRGEIDNALDNALSRGWKPVPRERWKGTDFDILKRNPLSAQYILAGDVILLEIETEILEQQRLHEQDLSLSKLEQSHAYRFKHKDAEAYSLGRF
jgi:hypothetical protein